jgi:hypothetical protein
MKSDIQMKALFLIAFVVFILLVVIVQGVKQIQFERWAQEEGALNAKKYMAYITAFDEKIVREIAVESLKIKLFAHPDELESYRFLGVLVDFSKPKLTHTDVNWFSPGGEAMYSSQLSFDSGKHAYIEVTIEKSGLKDIFISQQ